MNSIQQLQQLGQSVWLDYTRRGLIKSGDLKQLIDEGISGLRCVYIRVTLYR